MTPNMADFDFDIEKQMEDYVSVYLKLCLFFIENF